VDSAILKVLSKDDLVALILAQQVQTEAQAVQIGALTARIVELEARLDVPRKTPGNSSTPLSKGQKPSRPERLKKPHRGRPGVTRALWAIALSSDVRVQQWTLQLAHARSKQRLIQKINASTWPTSWSHFTLSGTQSIFEF